MTRERGREDRRVVYISLSEKGRKAYEYHARFHQDMIRGLSSALTPEEMEVLVKALEKLTSWFSSFQPRE